MPRTKKNPDPPAMASMSPVSNGPAGEVFTLAEAALYLRVSEADVIELVHSQGLPGRLISGEWRFLKTALQQWLSTPMANTETRKAALIAAAGAFKDDPDLIPIVEEIYRMRGRPITEDGSYNLLHGLEPGSSSK